MITHNWVQNEKVAEPKVRVMPDFNVKMYRDFDGLLDWAREKGVKGVEGEVEGVEVPRGGGGDCGGGWVCLGRRGGGGLVVCLYLGLCGAGL